MPIEFACQCGKKLRAAEEHAGKRAKCNQCGQIAVIPAANSEAMKTASQAVRPVAPALKKASPAAASKVAALSGLDDLFASELPLAQPAAVPKSSVSKTAAAAIPSGGRLCPGCRSPLSPVAVLCIHCGYNLNTGKVISTDSTEEIETPKKRPRSRMNKFLVSRMTSWKLWSGLGMMALAGVWFLIKTQAIQDDTVTLRSGRGFIYILILFVSGGISFINGLFDGDNA
jgi:hypothetical protein